MNQDFTVHEPDQLLSFLILRFPAKGRNKIKSLLTHQQVLVDGKVITRHDHPLQIGQQVSIRSSGENPRISMHGVRILHEDADLIVIDKPHGLLSIATDDEREITAYRVLMNYVQRTNPQSRVFIVHRLDRDTSGVMVFAKREAVKQLFQQDWKNAVQERSYVVIVEGKFKQKNGTITTWIKESQTLTMYVSKPGDGLKAITHYKVLQANNDVSLLEVHLETGRKNQIRVHMQSLGHSVLGDKRYGSTKNPLGRMALHAQVLSFSHPVTGAVMRFETGIPPEFLTLFRDK